MRITTHIYPNVYLHCFFKFKKLQSPSNSSYKPQGYPQIAHISTTPSPAMSPSNAETTGTQLASHYAPQIKGKIILTTGASPSGLGAGFVSTIAKAGPALLILAGRDSTKTQKTANAITADYPDVAVRVLSLDLSSLARTREAAATVNAWSDIPHIDVLMNNAGIMACDYGTTTDGFEKQFATNHLGPFLFTNLLMPKLLRAQKPRVVMVSSDGHRLSPIRFDDYNFDVCGCCALPAGGLMELMRAVGRQDV